MGTLLCLYLPAAAIAAAEGGSGKSAAQRLIEAYTPRLMLREGDEVCDTGGEQYEATSVNTVLGNPAVTLTEADSSGDETVLERAPSAADIARLGEGIHLNIPGDPLGDTCEYAKDFAKLKREGKAPAITYAHIAREAGRPDSPSSTGSSGTSISSTTCTRAIGRGCRSSSRHRTRPRRCEKGQAKSASSSTAAARRPTGPTARWRRRARTRSPIRRRARTRPSTRLPSTSRTGARGRGGVRRHQSRCCCCWSG